ncbi:mitochondrial inner membrane protease ATP23-like isoform X2 [Euphorbia lathyris]|uniref:mitochondrial inner membrane protease ATP23-like isoform X2 n=1 Tax=Euphorbia lathyris TaxID=212925 RepID=UPI0033137A0C
MENNPSQNPRPGGMTVEECNDKIRQSLRNPMVKFLREHLEKACCGVGDNFIKAYDCDTNITGGYVPGEGIVVCHNHLRIQDEVNQVVIHKLIHAYDQCRAANLNWSDCAHQACSEIRAGNLSGDCHFKRELLRGYTKLRGQGQHFHQIYKLSNLEFEGMCETKSNGRGDGQPKLLKSYCRGRN